MHAPPPKRSKRLEERNDARVQGLMGKARDAGVPTSGAPHDLTPLMFRPTKTGVDGREYLDTGTRKDMQRQIDSTSAKFKDLGSSNAPDWVKTLRHEAEQTGKTLIHATNRSATDGFRTGYDLTYTEHTGLDARGQRRPSDTPRPRSPSPHRTGEALTPTTRHEDTHQSAFQFTGLPGSTVNAPTQANQGADSHLERFIARSPPGSFIARRDSYTHSHLVAVSKGPQGVETRQASYPRRKPSASASTSTTPSHPSPSSSSSHSVSPSGGSKGTK